jgi:Spy/CpxP family protein refolding chaperone
MRRHLFPLFSFGLAAALTTSTWAQDEGGGRRRGGGFGGRGFTIDKVALMGSEQVKKELKVTEEQGKKIEEVLASHREALRGSFGGGNFRDLSDEERQKAMDEMAKKRAELVKKTDGALAAVLNKEQVQRLNEIHVQQQGVEALNDEAVVAALKLTDEQKAKIKGVITTRDEELAKLRPTRRRGEGGDGPPGGGEEARAKIDKVRKDADTAAFAVLTKEQNESLAKLKGAAFELDRSTLRGAGGFGGGGRGGRGGPGGGEGAKRERPKADEEI